MGKFEIFHGLNDAELAALDTCKVVRTYQAGDVVFAADSAGHELMLISRGEVKVSLPVADGKTIHLATFSRGQFFGEMSFLDGRAHSADVQTSRETELIAIDRRAFAKVAVGDPVMSISVMRAVALAIADRLRHANAELRKMANATPTPEAAIKLTVLAIITTSTITKKSSTVSCERTSWNECQST